MVLSVFGIDQNGNNNKVKVDLPLEVISYTPFEKALWEGRAFSAGTGNQDVDDKTYLNQRFYNPADSGKIAWVDFRVAISNVRNGKLPIEGGFIGQPVELEDAVNVSASNLYTGSASSVMQFSWNTSLARLNPNPPLAQDPTGIFVPTGGNQYRIETPRIIPPGFAAGIFIRGREASSESERVSISYVWYEVDEA